MTDSEKLDLLLAEIRGTKDEVQSMKKDIRILKDDMKEVKEDVRICPGNLPAPVVRPGVRHDQFAGKRLPQRLERFQAPLQAADLIFKDHSNGLERLAHDNRLLFSCWDAREGCRKAAAFPHFPGQ